MIVLPPMRDAIPLIWKAFNAQELQAQKKPRAGVGGMYSGPCAIGALLTEQERLDLDSISIYMGINTVVRQEYVVLTNPSELSDYERLQIAHDSWNADRDKKSLDEFVLLLAELEKKYPQ